MVKFFFLFAICTIRFSCVSQVIIFEHIGESDKPIYTLKYTTTDTINTESIEKRYVIDEKNYELLKDFVMLNKTQDTCDFHQGSPFGAFLIRVIEQNKNINYVLCNQFISQAYYKNLINFLLQNNEYNQVCEFSEILVRIR